MYYHNAVSYTTPYLLYSIIIRLPFMSIVVEILNIDNVLT